jgi:predicted ATPase/DNA-binding SARP family transcriptional activator
MMIASSGLVFSDIIDLLWLPLTSAGVRCPAGVFTMAEAVYGRFTVSFSSGGEGRYGAHMRFGVLGPLAVWTVGGEPVSIPGAKVRALLAVLLLHEGRLVSADRLVADLWGDDPPRRNPPGALSAKVSQLRRALEDAQPGGRELVVSRPPGYRLRLEALDDEAVDARRFHALTVRARESGDAAARAALLADALALWRGPAYADFADEPFTQAVTARLEEQRLTALEDAAEARLALGEHAVLAGELGELVAAHPLRERLRAAHMRALYGAGRQSEALDGYEEMRRRLADELGLDPGPELVALQRAILTQDLETPAAPAERLRSTRLAPPLPTPLTELIGREGAVAEIGALLDGERLVTLTGPGGVGKTRLVLEVAADRQGHPDLPDGVWLVELAGAGPGSVTDTLTAALDIRESEHADLAAALRSSTLLLVLDNCEHVIEEAAVLAERLLRAAPGLRILATSREPLGVAGEVVLEVPPLAVPGREEAEPSALAESSAVRLFVARTAAAVRGFTLNTDNAAAIGLLCRRLDGIPLALELAATRVRALGLHGVVDRLDDRFRLLATGHRGAPPRQRTLMAMIDWSWELLTGPEQAVLRRLAVHADGCTLEAAESVCGAAAPAALDDRDGLGGLDGLDGFDVLDLLVRLVDRSLVVVVRTADGPRYRLLESVAAYCVDRLRAAGEQESVRRRHRDHYLGLAEQAESFLRGPEQRRWLRRLDAEAANLRAVLDRCVLERDAAAGLRLVGALAWYWVLRGRLTEARRSLQAVLSIAADDAPRTGRTRIWLAGIAALQGDIGGRDAVTDLPDADRGRTAWFLAHAGLGHGDLADSEKLLARALDAATAERDRWAEAAILMTRAGLAHVRGDLAALERDAARSAELFTELGDRWGQMGATGWLAGLAEMTGDHDRATHLHRDALQLAEELGLWPEVATRLCWLGWIRNQLGDHSAALEHGAQALRLASEQGYESGEVFAQIVLGFAARRSGDLDAAEARLRHLLKTAPPQDGAPSVHIPMVLTELGFVAELRGDAACALRLHLHALDLAARLYAPRDTAGGLEGLAGALALAGDHARAAEVLGAAAAARQTNSLPAAPAERADIERATAACRAALGAGPFAAAHARGTDLTPEAVRLGAATTR